jgi:dynein heavy chain
LVDLIEFIKTVTSEQVVLQQRIDSVIKKYALLEEFFMEVSLEEFNEKWELYGWPKILKRKISDTEKVLQIERLRLIRDLRTNQKNLEQSITQLSDQVADISKYKDLEMAITVTQYESPFLT